MGHLEKWTLRKMGFLKLNRKRDEEGGVYRGSWDSSIAVIGKEEVAEMNITHQLVKGGGGVEVSPR